MYDLPPFLISITICEEPASIEFSINSLTIESGRSMTSPAAILSAINSSRILIIVTPSILLYPGFPSVLTLLP